MKKYHHCVVLHSGECYRKKVMTNESAQQQGERVWETTPEVFLVEIREDLGDDWGPDYYIRNVQ